MPFVVTENCIKCKYTDCVEVCPVDCFHEGPNFLVIDPDECIDCTLCEPECPVNAIYPEDDVPAGQEALRRAQRRAVEGLAGDHHAQGRAAGREGMGRQAGQAGSAGALSAIAAATPRADRGANRRKRRDSATKRAPRALVSHQHVADGYCAPSAVRSVSTSFFGAAPVAGRPRGSTAET